MNLIVDNFSSNNYWYRRYSDGFIEQGGRVDCSISANATLTLTYPISFTNTPLSLLITVIAPRSSESSGNEVGLQTSGLTNTSATLLNDGASTNKTGYYWEAKGY